MLEFIVFLYQRGRIDAVEAMMVMDRALQRRPAIGRIAVREGLLTVKEVMAILSAQAGQSPRRKFGETAVQMGFLSADDLRFLLAAQARASAGDPCATVGELTGIPAPELRGYYEQFSAA